ncbi:lipid A export permease/ATP-binding protein MsbA [Leptothrix discophora]|uniref:Lipid A export permease/ATP-binding protein MsbA n=1 Tax=Leptothrix discophora TaxID=89 RepID=A0ABT9G0U2_LEPDI|nr:lipid A export permease/ATP-binding protein MsbA [Leptothrix discophora]MDP4300087.1 lipid A export permease/ATP-binding protein MsbA [Leptothrix discophora]
MSHKQTATRLLGYLKPHKGEFAAGVACFFVSAAFEPAIPALLKQLLDRGFNGTSPLPVWLLPLIVIGLFVVRGVLSFAGTYLFGSSTSKAVFSLRNDLLRAVVGADASLYNTLSPGVAASRVINDPNSTMSSLSGAVITVLRDGTTLIAMLGYLFYLNWKLTLITFAIAPALAFVVRKVQKRVLRLGSEAYGSQIRLIGIVDDIIRAWRVVRTFDAGEFEQKRFRQEAQHFRRMTLKSVAAGATMTPLTQTVASLGVALILTLALIEANQGQATVGDFIAFITAMLMTISPMKHLTDVTQPIVGGLIGAQACFDLMDTPPEPDHGTRVLPDRPDGALRFERVTVRYPGSEHAALATFDLDIRPGQTIALVGPSGSGKTTVVNTLLGFVAPTEGQVSFDGLDLQDIRKTSLRRQFAVVSQDIVLFDGSIADNVAYVLPKDPVRIEQCLRAANLWGFVERMPEGVETVIGSNGSRLSGGQRQRLAIARALYKDARIWVFDEATSALDSESERAVQQSIEQLQGEKTLILIAHRLSTVRNADCIYVMGDGRVLECGRHEQLIAGNGLYASMVRAQAIT